MVIGYFGVETGSQPPSGWVVDVQKTVLKAEVSRQVRAQGLNTQTFRGVMTGGKIIDAQFPRQVGSLLGDLAAEVGIDAQGRRLLDKACLLYTSNQLSHLVTLSGTGKVLSSLE